MRNSALILASAMGMLGASASEAASRVSGMKEFFFSAATGNDRIRSDNTLSQKARRKRARQYRSQSFRKGGLS